MPGTMPYQDAITQFANQSKLPHYFWDLSPCITTWTSMCASFTLGNSSGSILLTDSQH